jgi:hypothetical protein
VAKRADLLRRVLADCFCQLQPSAIHGVGVFAIRKIPKGRDPLRTLAKYATTNVVRVTEDELATLQPKLAALIRALFVPTADKLYVPTSGLNVIHMCAYISYATRPNLRTNDGAHFIANREIRPGEVLTVDCRSYGARV